MLPEYAIWEWANASRGNSLQHEATGLYLSPSGDLSHEPQYGIKFDWREGELGAFSAYVTNWLGQNLDENLRFSDSNPLVFAILGVPA
jgi:hypothetical protein